MKNMSIERVIFGGFEFTLFGTLEVHKSLAEADFRPFIRRLLKGRNIATFSRCCLFGVQINSSTLMTSLRS